MLCRMRRREYAAVKERYAELNILAVAEGEISVCERALLDKPKVLDVLAKKRGLLMEPVRKYRLGWDGKRLWIPVFEKGKCVMFGNMIC